MVLLNLLCPSLKAKLNVCTENEKKNKQSEKNNKQSKKEPINEKTRIGLVLSMELLDTSIRISAQKVSFP